MSIYAVTAIRKCGTELYNEAQSWARTLDLPYIPRPIHGTLDQLLRDRGLKAVLVATHQGPQVYTEEGILKYHPSMGVPRIRNLKRGGSDHLAQACGFRPGMRVLDCTLGLAADAVVASFLVGPAGKVVGLEASPVLYWAVAQGLQHYEIEDPDITASLRRIEPRLGKAEDLLPAFPADSFDVVYFDPMFRKPVGNSASMQPLRPASYHKPLDAGMIRDALRLAPRVVVKERDEDLLRSLGAREIQGGKYSKLRYGIILREEGDQDGK
ncbi:hypothetical protein FX155_09360 [Acidaminococcus fermentans]|uniref:SAM-dependent methyltransferase n=1 Tax=Acidaminococcus fermentans TaxID=905 RepID=A0A6N7W3U0_ACIFE|nr:class I SAM-dependent methyltransferase [Acidaminococcus fermentans]MSS82798.1 hypothetical protein [Acidaminococcus fermentans]